MPQFQLFSQTTENEREDNGSGGGWTRTTELIRGLGYSQLQLPLCDTSKNLTIFLQTVRQKSYYEKITKENCQVTEVEIESTSPKWT